MQTFFRKEAMEEVIIYTDGACSGNPGPGGWGSILMYKENKKEISGGNPTMSFYFYKFYFVGFE